ncbi:MAG: aminotransferase class I/II-fold pyridoxal phosphate-dependent enzyme [Gammaproteobacteria bacterium]|jgi:glutamate/tyrosine decarboxylase-like PLP-dependent enzyme|nr:aminotransferase class I/II-fold pyridoxal phosphate-dependent enzyme [Gammaproteobacteria bacterium]
MRELEQELARLETVARRLEPETGSRRHHNQQVLDYADDFLETLPGLKTFRSMPCGALLAAMPVTEQPYSMEQVLQALARDVDTPGINPASGGHLGYIPGGGQYYAALGDYLADVFNRYAGVAYASPGAVQLEKSLLRWMADMVGYPAVAAGDLTSGGSMANLMGVVAAREAAELKGSQLERSPIYLTAQTHHCVDKALRIAGLGECPRRMISMDAGFRMDTGALAASIQNDRNAGLKPWLIVGSAGTTDTGSVDPLAEIADIAAFHGIWFHLDAAYGGFFMLSDHAKNVLKGIEQSDSVVIDPHKGLFLPYGSGAILVRDGAALHKAHYYDANYMQDARADEQDLSPADLSPELSRPFRGLRMWLPLMLCGLAPFRAALDEKLLLARYFHKTLSALPGWEVGPEPELSVVTYRHLPHSGDPNEFNRKLVQAIHDDGRVFVSSTVINGRFMLRLAVLHFRTHREQVDLLLELLAQQAARLSGS